MSENEKTGRVPRMARDRDACDRRLAAADGPALRELSLAALRAVAGGDGGGSSGTGDKTGPRTNTTNQTGNGNGGDGNGGGTTAGW